MKQAELKSPVKRAGRPKTIPGGGRMVATYLDEASISIASEIGHGNVSAGIREALRLAKNDLLDSYVNF